MRRSAVDPGVAFRFIACLVAGAGSIALIRDTPAQGQDFEVFWRAARAVLSGLPVYDVAREGGMVFKYPPWILPLFLPLGWVSLGVAKWIWGVSQVFCLFVIWRWLKDRVAKISSLNFTLASFWGIWAVHALDGQIALHFVALALLAYSGLNGPWRLKSVELLFWALSAKVLTLIALPGAFQRGSLKVWAKGAFLSALLFGVLSIPALWVIPGKNPIELGRSWMNAANSGGELLVGEKVRGRDNQGFPALVLRLAAVPASDSKADLFAFGALFLFFGCVLVLVSSRFTAQERFCLWLGLAAAVHPLAWFHLFAFAFPLAVISVDRARASQSRAALVFAIIGIACTALITRRTLGSVGAILELVSIKSWGVLLCAISLGVSARAKSEGSRSASLPSAS